MTTDEHRPSWVADQIQDGIERYCECYAEYKDMINPHQVTDFSTMRLEGVLRNDQELLMQRQSHTPVMARITSWGLERVSECFHGAFRLAQLIVDGVWTDRRLRTLMGEDNSTTRYLHLLSRNAGNTFRSMNDVLHACTPMLPRSVLRENS